VTWRARARRAGVRLGLLLVLPQAALVAQAQSAQVQRAIDFENAGRWREAVAAWRAVMAAGTTGQGLLGLERVFSQLGQDDSVLAPLDTALRAAPTDRMVRGVQLRVLRSLGRDTDARAAFHAWTALVPRDPVPYREYAGQLLNDGHAALADTVLQEASAALGGTKTLIIEVAQLRAALGLWTQAAVAWREAMSGEPYLEQAAIYSLSPAPAARRDSMRAVLGALPSPASVRRTLGALELAWGAPREGWRVLSSLTVADSAWQTWSDFADDAERLTAWIPARDALVAMHQQRPNPALALRAATASLNGSDATAALTLLAVARKGMAPPAVRTQVLPLEVRALSQLGRAADVETLVAQAGPDLDAGTRRILARQTAWAWIRAGDVEKARAAAAGAAGDDEDDVDGWIALYDGDLKRARGGLRRPRETTTEVVTAMALLGRTKADSGKSAGSAFLALAKGDSADAARRFERAADDLPDAAPLLLVLAARIQSARKQDGAAITLWQRILAKYERAPEAAEADLEWGKTLRRKGDASGAQERFEHLILTYPQSALVPQARRELDGLRAGAAT
jgi:tetratricopeptide (TPR) repeat protein